MIPVSVLSFAAGKAIATNTPCFCVQHEHPTPTRVWLSCFLAQALSSFSHAAFQVLGHYIRRQQDPETFISEIKYIASDPDDKYFFNVTDEAALNDIVDALGDRIFTLEGLQMNKNLQCFFFKE